MSFSGGVFSINTTGQPVVSGTTISASVFNALTGDLATGLSTCMLKDGTQTATAGIGFYAGTVSLPGIYFGTDTTTGFYRIGLNNTGFAINGTKLLDLSATTLGVTGVITASSTVTGLTFVPTGSSVPTNGMYLPAANTLGWATNSALAMSLDSSGSLQLQGNGVTTAGMKALAGVYWQFARDANPAISVTRLTNDGNLQEFYKSDGTLRGWISISGTTVTYNTSSDARLKNDRGIATDTSVLKNTIIHDFDWKTDGVIDRGVFAQEAILIKRSAVSNENDTWGVDYSPYVPDLIVGWQDHESRLTQDRTDIDAIKLKLGI